MADFDKMEFRTLKSKILKYYDGNKRLWLRFCLFDCLPVAELTRTGVSGSVNLSELFNALEKRGYIAFDNVKILQEIAELTETEDAVKAINKYIEENNIQGKATEAKNLTTYRRQLFKTLIAVGEDEIDTVVSHYNLDEYDFKNIWDVVFKLERNKRLEDDTEKIIEFADRLEKCAGDILRYFVIKNVLLNHQKGLLKDIKYYIPPTYNKDHVMDVSQVFTELELVKRDAGGRRSHAKQATLDQVLKLLGQNDKSKILIEGEAGMGKSTLLKYISWQWAEGKDKTFSSKILFLVEARNINQNSDIFNTMLKGIRSSKELILPNIQGFMKVNGNEVVVFLDGMDELNSNITDQQKIFTGLDNSKVIISSRPGNTSLINQSHGSYVKVLGFNSYSIYTFIDRFFKFEQNVDAGLKLKKTLKEYKKNEESDARYQLFKMCHSPMLLNSICTIWKLKGTFPEDMTSLFRELFCCIINQYSKKKKFDTIDNIPEPYKRSMLIIGECFYKNLKEDNSIIIKGDQLITRNSDGTEDALAIKIGFLYEKTSANPHEHQKYYTVPHKLIAESLAGFFVAQKYKDGTILDEKNSKYLHMCHVFAVKFLGANAYEFLEYWLTDCGMDYNCLVTYLMELQTEHQLIVAEKLDRCISESNLLIKTHFTSICNSIRLFLIYCKPPFRISTDDNLIQLMRGVRLLERRASFSDLVDHWIVAKISHSRSSVSKCLTHLAFASKFHDSILETNSFLTRDEDDLKQISVELNNLDFNYNTEIVRIDNRPIDKFLISHLLEFARTLWQIIIDRCDLPGSTLLSVFNKYYTKITHIEFSGNRFDDVNGSAIAIVLNCFPYLLQLEIINCHLSGSIVNEIILNGENSVLAILNFNENNLNELDKSLFCGIVQKFPNLRFLSMRNCHLNAANVMDMINEYNSALGTLPRTLGFDFHENDFSGLDYDSIITLLKNHVGFDFFQCTKNADELTRVVNTCYKDGINLNCTDLFTVKTNQFEGISGSTLSVLLNISPYLEILKLQGVTGAIIKDITFPNFLMLDDLDLSDSHLNDMSTSSLCILLTKVPKMRTLKLGNCCITSNLIIGIVKKLKHNKGVLELENLCLNGNHLNNVDGSFLSDLLVIAPKLELLDISKCQLLSDTVYTMLLNCQEHPQHSLLRALYLGENNLNNVNKSFLCYILKTFPNLQFLDLHTCRLTGSKVKDMLLNNNFSKVLMLEELYLDDNKFDDMDASTLCTLLTKAHKLKNLYLNDCELGSDVVAGMVNQFKHNRVKLNLEGLCLDGNDLSEVDENFLSDLLAITHKLSKLNMMNCMLTSATVYSLVSNCQQECTQLNVLDLGQNNLNNVDESLLFHISKTFPNLKKLNLYECQLSGSAITNMKNKGNANENFSKIEIDLEGNDLSDIDDDSLDSINVCVEN